MSWFRLAEGHFTLRNITDPVARYYHVLASLSQDAVRLVRHVLHEDTGPLSYDNLRTSLLASHTLSNYQKMERMMRLPPLGDQETSVMLAEMLEFCPAGESSTAVFAYLFLQRLPCEIRVLLLDLAAQPSCPDCQRAASSSALRVTTIKIDNTSIMVDTSSGVFCPLVSAVFRRPIFEVIHRLAHPGI